MPEPKRFMMMPNAEHSCATGILEAIPAAGAFINALLYQDPVPGFTWTMDDVTGDIVATLNEHGIVHSAHMWFAHSCGQNNWDNKKNRRDFRVAHIDNPCSCGPLLDGYCVNLKTAWQKQELNMTMVKGRRTYTAHVDMPTDGTYTAFFIDVQYLNKHAISFNAKEARESIIVDESKPKSVAQQLKLREVFPEFGGFPTDFAGFFEFTTEVSIVPDTFPYEDCYGVSCGVQLV
jgi:hypothetical protein